MTPVVATPHDVAGLVDAATELAGRIRDGATLWVVAPHEPHQGRHVAVEFLHPVITGKRAVAAFGVDTVPEGARDSDVAVYVGTGLVAGTDGLWTLHIPHDGPEATLAHHVLWELTHVVLEHEGAGDPALGAALEAEAAARIHVSRQLRAELAQTHAGFVHAATEVLVEAFSNGMRLWTVGNGGSAADAAAAANVFGTLPGWSLADDAGVVTALTNDVGFDEVFVRQVEAVAEAGDVVWAFSTSGLSENLLGACEAARKLGCATLACSGDTGGHLAASDDIGACATVASESVHRIQEVHEELVDLVAECVLDRLDAEPA